MTQLPPISNLSDIEMVDIDRVEVTLEPWSWAFAQQRRDDIADYFAAVQRRRSAVWNGRVLLLHRHTLRDGVLRGACFETDYASFLAWRDWGFPDRSVYNVFAAGALATPDGAFLLGEMAPTTANAGMLYFPCGTPEPGDVGPDGVLDLEGNVRRELFEETGIAFDDDLTVAPGWTLVIDRCYVGLMKRLAARQSADALCARVRAHIAAEAHPELVDIHIVRGLADLRPTMPPAIIAFLEREWRR
jgi:8-oxo-dGTP pyrophosphatase MutT (NUDIX family)